MMIYIYSERLEPLESLVDNVPRPSAEMIPAVLEGGPATVIPDYSSKLSVGM